MKRLITAAVAILLVAMASGVKKPVEKILVGGSYWDSIAIINKSTGAMEWAMALPVKGSECNSVAVNKKGEILFSYKKGARLVDRQGNTIWDYPETAPGAELQTARVLPNGNYMLASCGNPMRIVELNKKGRKIKEITYDLGIANPHSQFRVVTKSRNGNYLIPTFGRSNVVEINGKGELVRTYENLKSAFSLIELPDGNLLVSCGSTHEMVEIDRKTGEQKVFVSQNDIEGATIQFVAGSVRLPNGNTMISNWQGYVKGGGTDAQIIEFDSEKRLVWSYRGAPRIKNISAIYPFSE